MRPDATPLSPQGARRLKLAILFTIVAVALGAALLIKETAIVFTAFMFLGPGLLSRRDRPARLDDPGRAAREARPLSSRAPSERAAAPTARS